MLVLLASTVLPVSALFHHTKQSDVRPVPTFHKQVINGHSVPFSPDDFLSPASGPALSSITITDLPDPSAGLLTVGAQPVTPGTVIERSALAGLRFQSMPLSSCPEETTFTFRPNRTDGAAGSETPFTLHLLSEPNQAPIAKNMDLSTYKNVALTGWFDAMDMDGDALTFQLTSTPARGAVTLAEDGSSQFVYTPYENKTGKDSFSYVAVDPAGNVSPEAKVTIRIVKPDTKVTYADMDGNPAHKASIRLAEEGVYVGSYRNGSYYFQPDQTVSRGEFLSMAMSVAELEPLEDVSVTGFYDDAAIPTWCKGYVSSALKAGAIQGSADSKGQPVFGADSTVTLGEATVMLNSLLNISDVPQETFCSTGRSHWAGQAAANLASAGILRPDRSDAQAMSAPMTMGEVAELLDGALDVMANRQSGAWFHL